MSRQPALVSDSDRLLVSDQLSIWIASRTTQRARFLPDEPTWDHCFDSSAGIRSEAGGLFPGPRSAWVR